MALLERLSLKLSRMLKRLLLASCVYEKHGIRVVSAHLPQQVSARRELYPPPPRSSRRALPPWCLPQLAASLTRSR